jgi:malate synthase
LQGVRAQLQAKIDRRHREKMGTAPDGQAYRRFLEECGYLVPVGPLFEIDTNRINEEIASIPGPQLVVPVTNARYVLNAGNARWVRCMTRSMAPMRWVLRCRPVRMSPTAGRA